MAFFMTLGSASSESVEAGAHQCPAGRRCFRGNFRTLDREAQREMREHMLDGRRERISMPLRTGARRGASRASLHSVPGTSLMPPKKPARRAAAEQDRAIGTAHDIGGAVARGPLPFWCLDREFRLPAVAASDTCARTRGRGRRRASSACRSSLRDPSAPRRILRRARMGRAVGALRGSAAWHPARASSIAKTRAITRSTLPSITAICSSKAIAAIAAEV